MTLRRCLGCSATYPPDLHACPHCDSHAGESIEDGEAQPEPKPKATKATKRTTRGKAS